jgi:hypothetical protein
MYYLVSKWWSKLYEIFDLLNWYYTCDKFYIANDKYTIHWVINYDYNNLSTQLCLSVGILLLRVKMHHFTMSLFNPTGKCFYQAMKMRGHVFVCYGYRICHVPWFLYWILELFGQCGIFWFSCNLTLR